MKILCIENEGVLSDGLMHILQNKGYSVSSSVTGRYVLQLLQVQDFDLIVLDLVLPDIDGLRVLRNRSYGKEVKALRLNIRHFRYVNRRAKAKNALKQLCTIGHIQIRELRRTDGNIHAVNNFENQIGDNQ